MDGQEALERLYDLLNEDSDSNFISKKMAYAKLNEAALEFVDRTNCLKATQTITTVADQVAYKLNADFLKLYLRDSDNQLYIKYGDSTFLRWCDYEDIVYSNNTDSVSIPDRFSIIDYPDSDTRLSGTTTSSGSASHEESTLIDSGADWSSVSAGDCVHNITDGSSGYVLSVGTNLTTALFDGSNNEWAVGDGYIIQPQGRLELVLDPPPSDSGDSVTVQYIQRPKPMYSKYGSFRFQPQHMTAVIKYAAWLEKYKDDDANMGDALYQAWELQTRKHASSLNSAFNRKGFRMNLKARK